MRVADAVASRLGWTGSKPVHWHGHMLYSARYGLSRRPPPRPRRKRRRGRHRETRRSMTGGTTRSADVVVIGGGIVGCATAYHLARRGARVILLEKGRVAHEQSSRNMGAVRQQARDPIETPL